MTWQMRFSGGAELASRLRAMPMLASRVIRLGALKKAAGPIRATAQSRAPRSGLPGSHLQDHIVVQTVTRVGSVQGGRWQRTGGDEAWVAIGPQSAFFYGLFQEYGTRFHRAQPFLRPALDGEAQVALGILGRELWAALRLAAPQTFTPATPGSSGLL